MHNAVVTAGDSTRSSAGDTTGSRPADAPVAALRRGGPFGRVLAFATAGLLAAGALTACAQSVPGQASPGPLPVSSSAPRPSSPEPTPSTTPAVAVSPRTCAEQTLAALSPRDRVGQLFLLGVPAGGLTDQDRQVIAATAPGGVFLTGRDTGGVAATAATVAAMQRIGAAAAGGVALFVAVDQEGGEVQVLSGPGFDAIPSAAVQGGWTTQQLADAATTWGRQLHAAGINVDLAPVADVVPTDLGSANVAIGQPRRSYGPDPASDAGHVAAFVRGLAAAGVISTVKHFPGLGRVRGDTDYTAGVTDDQTTRTDADLQPFAAAVQAGTGWLMVSSAIYTQIDPSGPAVFSPTVVSGMARDQLHFAGLVVSDELGNAVAVKSVPAGQRAVAFLSAGGDVLLTADAADLTTMTAAVLARVGTDAQFAQAVTAAETRVLTAKISAGLLPCPRG